MHQSNDMYGIQQDCNPKKFMKLCKDALRDATVKESVMSEMSLLMNAGSEYSESSPTSYLLRRNFATDISSVCGMDEDEIKYMIGHAIYIPEERRSDFLNPDTLYRLWKKLNRRQFFHQHPSDFEITNKAIEIHQKEASVCVSEEQLAQHPDGVLLKVWNDYPNDYIKLSVNEGSLEGSFMSVLQEPVPLKKAVRVKIYREFSNAVAQSRNRMRKSKSKSTTQISNADQPASLCEEAE